MEKDNVSCPRCGVFIGDMTEMATCPLCGCNLIGNTSEDMNDTKFDDFIGK